MDEVLDGHLVPARLPAEAVPVAGTVILSPVEPSEIIPHEPSGTIPDTKIAVSNDTTVVVQTETQSVRYYALMLKTHLYNGGRKVKGTVAFIKGRLSEKSTYVFLGAGVAAASALPSPWSFLSMGLSVVASMVPDHVILNDGSHT